MSIRKTTTHARLLSGVAAAAIIAFAGAARAEDSPTINIAPQSLASALYEFGGQTGHQVLFTPDIAAAKTTRGVSGATDQQLALAQLLDGTGLTFRRSGDTFLIEGASDPQSGSAAGDGADGTVAALIVTAQKKEEAIQDVPIAISAFTEKNLEEQKIEGGFDLLKAIPNVTFSKNNFSSYNFSIRGIGTKAISVTTDPGVAVAFNGSSLIRNRLFEQEYFDVERVEVLRGPQGTLNGRNATAGVINVISGRPHYGEFDAWVKGEVGNYETRRLSGMVNIPLIGETVALRLAGAWTKRDGYDFNATTGHPVNGRDLWSTRVTLGLQPTDSVHVNLIWEHFNEDDDRSRTGKQLCHRDAGITVLAGITLDPAAQGHVSQGCKAGSLYDDGAFGTPNGLSIPFMQVGVDPSYVALGSDQNGNWVTPVKLFTDPYGGMMQSRDLRTINSIRDPRYQASTDVLELNADFDLGHSLTLTSQTAYVRDKIYSFQDYNRFNTVPILNDSLLLSSGVDGELPPIFRDFTPNGVFCDPQIGCSNTIAGFDISRARSKQFSQEFRLQSSFDGPVNFSAGMNFTRYKTVEDYFVFYNLITLIAQSSGGIALFNASPDVATCAPKIIGIIGQKLAPPVPLGSPEAKGCIYIDPNPIESINGDGHNYFRSKNPYGLKSWAGFGEVYWTVNPEVKITAGLRYTSDRKTFIPVPSQVLLSSSGLLGGTVDRGYPEKPAIKQGWDEVTGRLGFDWSPKLEFTDKSLFYAFYSRGYKGGGANPPGIGYRDYPLDLGFSFPPIAQTLPYPAIFKPEFVNAFEVGSKNTLMGGSLVLNGDVFFYDYKDYQVSQIKERTAVNENFNAKVWGAELESVFQPTRDLRLNFTFGYQGSRIANGEESIDLMNRTQGDPNLVVVKPYVLLTSNCVVPKDALEAFVAPQGAYYTIFNEVCGGALNQPLNPLGGPNGGAGVYAQLGGNALPNAPHWTTSFGIQYGRDLPAGWRATIRSDAYWQSQSWARVYNAVNDKLHGWYNVNLSLWVEKPDLGLKVELYAKNLLDKSPITDAFLNSDDTALTTNVFVLDPRLIGLSVKKDF
jgi:outer membrane receptor protein involved in Fe transport